MMMMRGVSAAGAARRAREREARAASARPKTAPGERPKSARRQMMDERLEAKRERKAKKAAIKQNAYSNAAYLANSELNAQNLHNHARESYQDGPTSGSMLNEASTKQQFGPKNRTKFGYAYKPRMAFWLGVVQITFGIVIFISGCMAIITKAYHSEFGVGIWGGMLFMTVGGIGFTTANKANRPRLIFAYMVLTVISIAVSIICIYIGANGMYIEGKYMGLKKMPNYVASQENLKYHITSHVMIAICGAAEAIAFFFGFINCTRELCYNQKYDNKRVIYRANAGITIS